MQMVNSTHSPCQLREKLKSSIESKGGDSGERQEADLCDLERRCRYIFFRHPDVASKQKLYKNQ